MLMQISDFIDSKINRLLDSKNIEKNLMKYHLHFLLEGLKNNIIELCFLGRHQIMILWLRYQEAIQEL